MSGVHQVSPRVFVNALHSNRVELRVEAAGEGGSEVGGRPGDHGAEGRVAEGNGREEGRQEPLFRRGEGEQTLTKAKNILDLAQRKIRKLFGFNASKSLS